MNRVASKLRSVVPANDLKSLNRLEKEREDEDLNIISFRADVCFVKSGDEDEIPNEMFRNTFQGCSCNTCGLSGCGVMSFRLSMEAVKIRAAKVHSAMSLIS